MKTVAHFIRKNTQLKSSFIQNQILNHINYKPVIIYKYESAKDDGGFADFHNDFPTLNLASGKKFDFNFRYLKKLSRMDVKKALRFLDEWNVSILHLHYGSDSSIYSDLMRYSGRPSVVSFYGYDASSFSSAIIGYGGWLLRNRVFPHVTKVLAMSPDMKKDLVRSNCPEDKIIVHYYGSEVNKFYWKDRTYLNKENVIFLILASLVPQKGHLFLLKALKKIIDNGISNISLRIVGGGELERQLKDFVSKNKLNDFVTFIGAVEYGSADMKKELYNADVFIHPSVTANNGDKEGIPGTIIEAMSSGLPVISTYHAGIPFVIENNVTGLLVNEWDVDGLVKAIERLVKDVDLRKKLGTAGQMYAVKFLNIKEKEIELEEIYDSLLV